MSCAGGWRATQPGQEPGQRQETMQSMEQLVNAHLAEMKELNRELDNSSKALKQDWAQMDRELAELKKRVAGVPGPTKKPTPLHVRILSLLF